MAFQAPAMSAPCDIYASAGTPCVAAYSMVRPLSTAYTGPLYQVRREDGTTKDIGATGGFANVEDQESFCGAGDCFVSILYDQSGKQNDLIKAPAGCNTGSSPFPSNEANVKGRSITVAGHKAYGLYMVAKDGYRNNNTSGMPVGSDAQGIYVVADGTRGGEGCCWNFGNASTNNCNGSAGNMAALFLGVGHWGKGTGTGPWWLVDFEGGLWAGGSQAGDPGWGGFGGPHPENPNSPSMAIDFAFGTLKTNSTNYAIRAGNAQSGDLATAYDGALPSLLQWNLQGGIILGTGGDNSNASNGTFYEGAITFGRPSDTTDTSVFRNVQAAGYGSTSVSVWRIPHAGAPMATVSKVKYHPSLSLATIQYSLREPHRLTLSVFDTQGRLVKTLVDGKVPQGEHEAVWSAKGVKAGLYIASLAIDGQKAWTTHIVVKK